MGAQDAKPVRDVAAAVIQDTVGRVLLLQRGATAPTFPGHWGPVTGLVEAGETPAEAALREMQEEIGLGGRIVRAGAPFLVDVGAFAVRVHPFLCELIGEPGDIHLHAENQRHEWLPIAAALARQAIPGLDRDFRALGLL